MNVGRRVVPVIFFLIVGVAGWLARSFDGRDAGAARVTTPRGVETAAAAFAARQSEVWVEDEGTAVALLRDDLDGSRHQKFLVRLPGGTTILVSHNIDIAPRVPLEKGDVVTLRGEYVWNEQGGLVHWTHHDPQGRQPGGWVSHAGLDYR